MFQLCDSNFPTGAFSHSFGLESYIQEETVYNPDTFTQWLHIYVNEQLIYSDGLASHLVFQALEEGDIHRVWKLDRLLTVQNLPRETREGTQRMGESMLNLVSALYDTTILAAYRTRILAKQSMGHPAIVFTMIAQHLEVPRFTTVLYYLYSVVSSLVQNAVRAIPLGQTAGQRILHDIQPVLIRATEKIMQMDEGDFGIVSPGLELSQMMHERIHVRIFMS
ncbi:urease accessory protein UreF [Paenibacillus terrigena]|uniref:urease accessory protein UreF n=1 Tax=Paenibacillus terrigena TaxID=369333 RepID=UPI0028D90B93|nr:urease accessory protein UreF [Paenibacillus terrigena]